MIERYLKTSCRGFEIRYSRDDTSMWSYCISNHMLKHITITHSTATLGLLGLAGLLLRRRRTV